MIKTCKRYAAAAGRLIAQHSWVIPELFVIHLSRCEPGLYIHAINFNPPTLLTQLVMVFVLAYWGLNQPDGLTPAQRVMHNVLPVEIVCMLMLAQYQFDAVLCVLIVAAAALSVEAACCGVLAAKRLRRQRARRIRVIPWQYRLRNIGLSVKRQMKPWVLLTLFSVFLAPSYVLLTQYGAGKGGIPSDYRQFIHEQVAHGEDVRAAYEKTLALLDEERWARMTVQERVDVLQAVACVEAEYLSISAPPLMGVTMEDQTTLAHYNHRSGRISVSLGMLETSSPQECVDTVAHECRHAYQHAAVDALDWSDERIQKLEAFYWVRRWKYEFDHYASGTDDFQMYYGQEVEADARIYASERLGAYEKYFYAN